MMRLFLSLEPDSDIHAHILAVQRQIISALRGAGLEKTVRAVSPHAMHMTLLFLGDVEESSLNAVAQHLLEAAQQVPIQELEAARISAFPSLSAARVIWLGVAHNDALQMLHADLSRRLAPLCVQMDAKPLRPHLTLARVNRIDAAQRRRLAQILDALPQPQPVEWTARELRLVRSQLLPGGAQHAIVTAAPFANA